MLSKKIDFALIIRVKNANPNGDPLNGNRPRVDYEGIGEITDICLKRKIRDRLSESGESIFVQSNEKKTDDAKHLKERAERVLGKKLGGPETSSVACETWFDVRSFGQVFAFKNEKKGTSVKNKGKGTSKNEGKGTSVGVRGPVTIQSAFSLEPVSVTSTQITKSVNLDEDSDTKATDTMGMKHRVDNGIYVTYGSMNPQLSEKTGFSDKDADTIKSILPKIFENDASSARPEGSMEVIGLIWWEHNCKCGQYSSAKVHQSLTVDADGSYDLTNLDGLEPDRIPGF